MSLGESKYSTEIIDTVVHSNREFSDEGNLLASGGDLGRFEDDRFLDIERPQLLAEI